MKLIEFSYRDANWELRNLEFGAASLIVGKNATGKSRTLKQLSNLFKIIKQTVVHLPIGEFHAKFQKENGEVFIYQLIINGGNLHNLPISEKLYINDQVVLERSSFQQARLLNIISNTLDPINPPANKLVIHVNRDVKKYPFLEDIATWAEQSYSFKFGAISTDFHNVSLETNLSVLDDIATLYTALNNANRERILSDLVQIGFFIENVDVKKGGPVDYLEIKEKGIMNVIEEQELSQGMLRSLYLVIFIQYLISTGKTSTIIIDDLCEGLDYERATKLGKMVYAICRDNNIQLIATSNDMFLMDVVDLEYWNVLQRTDGIVTSVNAKNHPELFESFKFTGLSNFDFFASDYIPQKIEK